jgi:hypothetical protein
MTSVAQPKDKAGSTKAQVDEALHRRPAATHEPVPPPIQAIVDAKDRTDADRQLDASRHPGELLGFLGLRPGMRVAELSAGGCGAAASIDDPSPPPATATGGGSGSQVQACRSATLIAIPDGQVKYLASFGGSVYWVGLHADCVSSTDCAGFTPYVAVGTSGAAPVELFTGVPTNSWSNLLVDARGITVVQESAEPPASPDAVLLRIPFDGGQPATLDTQLPTTFTGSALASCGEDVCWFGRSFASPQATAFVRVPDGASPEQTVLPASAGPEQDVFLAMNAERIYYLEGNFDTYGPADVTLRSMSTSGEDARALGSPRASAGAAAIAFDAQSVYLAASDGIHVVSK